MVQPWEKITRKKVKNTTFFGREISTILGPIFKISKILVTYPMMGGSEKWHPIPIPRLILDVQHEICPGKVHFQQYNISKVIIDVDPYYYWKTFQTPTTITYKLLCS